MFRWLLSTAIRGIKRGIPSFKPGALEGTRQASNVHNGIVQFTATREQRVGVNFYREFFFSHWIRMTSRNTRLRCNPVQHIMASQRMSTPLFLAFVGFAYIGKNNDLHSENFTKSDQNTHKWLQDALKKIAHKIPEKCGTQEGTKLKDYDICERLGKPSSEAAVYAVKMKRDSSEFAIKMLFNYNSCSKSHSLKKAFSKEVTVLSGVRAEQDCLNFISEASRYTVLPQHPNIMNILWHFSDDVPKPPDATQSYPAALPPRLHEEGYGRNRTMFLVMPRFSGTLSNYVSAQQRNISTKKSLALFAQLLEGLVHLNKNNVAHRDLKEENLLVNETSDGLPHLVITDFGCCLAEKDVGLVLPYETDETSKGGNTLLMAPEVICAKPGRGHVIDYSKADVWAAGALVYEMFGQQHPFKDKTINKENYEASTLLELMNAPKTIQKLVKQLLQRHPNDRPDVSFAATVCQLVMWAPELLMMGHKSRYDLIEDIKRWLRKKTLDLAVEILQSKTKCTIPVDQRIFCTFLSRTTAEEIFDAIQWLEE